MISKLVGCFLLALSLTLGGCVIYDRDHGYYDGSHFRYHYWGPPIQFRFDYHGGRHGLNQEDSVMRPVFQVEYWDAPFMCVDPDLVEMSEG